jgi:hypothetical protein
MGALPNKLVWGGKKKMENRDELITRADPAKPVG